MSKLRELLKEHQEATGCDDSQMLDIVTRWVDENVGWRLESDLISFVVNELDDGPPRR